MAISYLQEYVGSPTFANTTKDEKVYLFVQVWKIPTQDLSLQRYYSIGPNKTWCANMSSFCGKGLGPCSRFWVHSGPNAGILL